MSIRQVVYVSQASEHLDKKAMGNILRSAWMHNAEDGISGILLYNRGQFLQVLEGDSEKVQSLLHRLQLDPRHEFISVMSDLRVPEREFEYWLMGFKDFSTVDHSASKVRDNDYDGTDVEHPTNKGELNNVLVDTDFILEVSHPSKAITLLRSFLKLV